MIRFAVFLSPLVRCRQARLSNGLGSSEFHCWLVDRLLDLEALQIISACGRKSVWVSSMAKVIAPCLRRVSTVTA